MGKDMGKVTCDITMSVDGYVAGPDQRIDQPLGTDGELLHRWMLEEGDLHAEVVEKITAAGAFIMGRNMFASGRGEWDPDWTGWWGEDPPYHAPVFVLTHYPRETIPMKGGTSFSFVTEGIDAALARAREAAGERDVAICGGAQTVNQYLAAGHIDELRLHIAPMVLGGGERLFTGVGDLGLDQVAVSGTALVTHVTYRVGRWPRRCADAPVASMCSRRFRHAIASSSRTPPRGPPRRPAAAENPVRGRCP